MSYIDRLAAQHMLTLHDPGADGEAIRSALDWIDHDRHNLVAFNRADRFMRACGEIGPQELAGLKLSPIRPGSHRRRICWRMAAIAASMLLIFIACAQFLLMENSEIAQQAHFATPAGTIRSIQLADGSNVTLAGASAIDVTFRNKARRIRLLSGEALFTVAPDKNRPFTVQTQNGTATAVGTAFNVHRGADDTTVTVLHGRVEVLARGTGFLSRATLDRTMEVHYSDTGEMGRIERVDPDMIASWRHGEFRFADTPLASVIEDLNRYSARPIIIEDPALRDVKISGVVTANGILEWLGALPAIVDVQIIETPRNIRIRMRSKRNAIQT